MQQLLFFQYSKINLPLLGASVFFWVFNNVVCDGEEDSVMLLVSETRENFAQYDREVEREFLTNVCPSAVFFFLPAKKGENDNVADILSL